MRIRIGETVSGKTPHTNDRVVGTVEGFDHREGTVRVRTVTGTHLCRLETVVLLNPVGSPGAIRHLQMCPDHLLCHMMPETAPC